MDISGLGLYTCAIGNKRKPTECICASLMVYAAHWSKIAIDCCWNWEAKVLLPVCGRQPHQGLEMMLTSRQGNFSSSLRKEFDNHGRATGWDWPCFYIHCDTHPVLSVNQVLLASAYAYFYILIVCRKRSVLKKWLFCEGQGWESASHLVQWVILVVSSSIYTHTCSWASLAMSRLVVC